MDDPHPRLETERGKDSERLTIAVGANPVL
jgi:hypothetical protein